jgi:hypothetical protein
MSVAQRVAKRRRNINPVDALFIPKKGVTKRTATRKPQRPRQAPVFGVASLMDAAEHNLVVALGTKPPGARIVNHEDLEAQVLPADPQDTTVHVNFHENLNRGYVDGEGVNAVVVAERSHCVCGGLGEDEGGLIACATCARAYHSVCVGKGRHGHSECTVSQHLDDVRYYLLHTFSCPDCDKKASAKRHITMSSEELSDEKARRDLVFAKRDAIPADETEPRICDGDSCQIPIVGARFECRYCFAFDLCAECWVDPEITSKHQHVKGDKKWHYH